MGALLLATTNGQPTLYLEGGLSNRWSIETCGTGTGFVHQETGVDFMHMRGKYDLFERSIGDSSLNVYRSGICRNSSLTTNWVFSSMELHLSKPRPEVSGSAQWLIPLSSNGNELWSGCQCGCCVFEYGPELTLPHPNSFPLWRLV